MGCAFYETGNRQAKTVLDILFDSNVLWTTKDRTAAM